MNYSLTPRVIKIDAAGTEYLPTATERVLLADATISNSTRPTGGNNFTQIKGGWVELHSSPHLGKNGIPEGGNAVMLDGHGEWRKFDKLVVRTEGNAPYFWW